MSFKRPQKGINTGNISKKERKLKKIYYDKYRFSTAEAVKYSFTGILFRILVCWLCYHSVYSLPLAAVILFFYLKNKKQELIGNRKKILRDHFADMLEALNTALSAGYSVENGIRVVLSDMIGLYGENDVITNELRIISAGLSYKKTVEELFAELAERSDIDDIKLFSEMLIISKRKGGTIGKLLNDTKNIIREKNDTLREKDKVLSSKLYELKIMSAMPAAVILYLRLTFDGFIEQLYKNAAGAVVMSICLLIYMGAYMLGKRIINIDI